MAILLNNDGYRHAEWKRALKTHLPRRTIHTFSNVPDIEDINYAIVWNHPKGDLQRYPNLKAVLSAGAGTEHFDSDPNLPNAPIIRLVDMDMAEDMALYVLYWVIHIQRGFENYRRQQQTTDWTRHPAPMASDVHILVLGLGAIGAHIANKLARNGFQVSGWSKTVKNIMGVTCLTGKAPLREAFGQTNILVNCLPLNSQTQGFLNENRFAALKQGASVINISRGAIIDDAALMQALDSKHITSAVLDVFRDEPLSKRSPFWTHPRVHVTPHISGMSNPETAAPIIAKSIKMIEHGETPPHIYQRDEGSRP